MTEVKSRAESITDKITQQMCEHYCKYPTIWDEEKEGMPLEESYVCQNCPLDRLPKVDGRKLRAISDLLDTVMIEAKI